MPRKGTIKLSPPEAGVVRRAPASEQPARTTPRGVNVIPQDTLEKRIRCGSRPGMGRKFTTQLGGGEPVQMLTHVTVPESNGFRIQADTFGDDPTTDVWSRASWTQYPCYIWPDDVLEPLVEHEYGALVRENIDDLDPDKPYQCGIWIVPYGDQFWGYYRIYMLLDDDTPDYTQDGLLAEIYLLGPTGSYAGGVTVNTGGIEQENEVFVAGALGRPEPIWFRCAINGSEVSVYLGDTLLHQFTMGAEASGLTGTRTGLGMRAMPAGGVCVVGTFETRYYSDSVKHHGHMNYLIASSAGKIYQEKEFGQLEETVNGATINLSTNHPTRAVQYEQKVYIADWDHPGVENSEGTAQVDGTEIVDPNIENWFEPRRDIDTYNCVCEVYDGTGVTTGVYELDSIEETKLVLKTAPGTGTCSYRVLRGPKIYDPVTKTLPLWLAKTAKGSVPPGCALIELYSDRTILAGDIKYPQLWYASRRMDPRDWQYGDIDVGTAIYGGYTTKAGVVPQAVTGLIAHSDDQLIFGCETELHIQRGDWLLDGQIDALDAEVGMVNGGACCSGPNGETYVLSWNGFHRISEGSTGAPLPISPELIPDEMCDVWPNANYISMVYDSVWQGVWIFITPAWKSASSSYDFGANWHFFWSATKNAPGLWYQRIHVDREPTAVHSYPAPGHRQQVILGCRDGYLRYFSRRLHTDDAAPVESTLMLGPRYPGGREDRRGCVQEILGRLGRDSGEVHWEIVAADSANRVLTQTPCYFGRWTAGLNEPDTPDAGGVVFAVQMRGGCEYDLLENDELMALENDELTVLERNQNGTRWAFEGAICQTLQMGAARPER